MSLLAVGVGGAVFVLVAVFLAVRRQRNGPKALERAFLDWDLEKAAEILKARPADARLDISNGLGITRLHEVAKYGPIKGSAVVIKAAALLLQHGADSNAQDSDGKTPLIIACADNTRDWALAAFLLTNGGNPNIKDKKGNSASHWIALRANDVGLIELMMKAGADLALTSDAHRDRTPLQLAKGRRDRAGDALADVLERHGGR